MQPPNENAAPGEGGESGFSDRTEDAASKLSRPARDRKPFAQGACR